MDDLKEQIKDRLARRKLADLELDALADKKFVEVNKSKPDAFARRMRGDFQAVRLDPKEIEEIERKHGVFGGDI